MSYPRIAFIGAGNMAKAIIGGLLAEGFDAKKIIATGTDQARLAETAKQLGIAVSIDNLTAVSDADIVVLAVKPQLLKAVSVGLAAGLAHRPLIISVAAGITTESLNRWLGEGKAIVRAMPNTPSQLRLGATGVYANGLVSDTQKHQVEKILGAVGLVIWQPEESLIDAVTAVSGSGPAYFFLMMEAMIEAGIAQGLSEQSARELTLQTALGTATLAKQSALPVAQLRQQVTSPNGTTERAILSFEADDIRSVFKRAMTACADRAAELSEQLGE